MMRVKIVRQRHTPLLRIGTYSAKAMTLPVNFDRRSAPAVEVTGVSKPQKGEGALANVGQEDLHAQGDGSYKRPIGVVRLWYSFEYCLWSACSRFL